MPAPSRGLLLVLSGPSGVGKGTVRARLLERYPGLRYGVSATTRPRRAGEVDGISYHFLSPEDFRRRADRGEFVEWAQVHGNLYGTPRRPMEDWLAEGCDVVVEKDIQGAAKLKEVYPDAVYVFLLPPSMDALAERINRRGTDPPDVVARRLAAAALEMSHVSRYDYVVVNDVLDEAVRKLEAILTAEKCRVGRHPELEALTGQGASDPAGLLAGRGGARPAAGPAEARRSGLR